MSPATKRRALAVLRAVKAEHRRLREAWEYGAALDRAEGYRPSHCLHGTNMWTDYDPMCPGCEEYGYNGLPSPYVEALGLVRRAEREVHERVALIMPIAQRRAPQDVIDGLTAWATAPLEELPTGTNP